MAKKEPRLWMKAVHSVMIPNPTVEAGTTQNPNFLTIRPPGISARVSGECNSVLIVQEIGSPERAIAVKRTGEKVDDKVEAGSDVELVGSGYPSGGE